MASEVWDDGSAYEPFVGRWSRLVAEGFLQWLAVPPRSAWLDFGCGTGALSQIIAARTEPRIVIGCDRSAGYTAFAAEHTCDERVRFVVAELPDLPEIPNGYDAAVAGLVLNFLPTPSEGVAAMRARLRRSGILGAYVWDYAAGMQMLRVFWDAAVALDSTAGELDEGTRFPLCHPQPLRQLFEVAGLRHVEVQPIEVVTVFRDFADYWTPFLGGQGPAPGYAKSLNPERQAALREAIQARLPTAADGSTSLMARAWAAKGIAT